MKKIAFGGDHAGFDYKTKLSSALAEKYEIKDFGPYSTDSADYPDFVHPVAEAVASGEADFGILICGSGNGVAMTANKHKNVRAGLCWQADLARLTREHNNANVLCLPARYVSYEAAEEIVNAFLNADFEGGRHAVRVDKIENAG